MFFCCCCRFEKFVIGLTKLFRDTIFTVADVAFWDSLSFFILQYSCLVSLKASAKTESRCFQCKCSLRCLRSRILSEAATLCSVRNLRWWILYVLPLEMSQTSVRLNTAAEKITKLSVYYCNYIASLPGRVVIWGLIAERFSWGRLWRDNWETL